MFAIKSLYTTKSLVKEGLVKGLSELKFAKDQIYVGYENGNMKRASHKPKSEPSSKRSRSLIHMDLCGPIMVQSINSTC